MKKKKAKRLQGARKRKKGEEMAWAPPRNKSDWLDWEEARSTEKTSGGWSQREKCGRKHLRGP